MPPANPTDRSAALTQDNFDRLLAWLDQDRERAGQRYEVIRNRLIKLFTCRGCAEAEDLADETINRVIARISDIADKYVGDPIAYFYAVAGKIHLEYLRKIRRPSAAPPVVIDEDIEEQFDCLEQCMQTLPPENQQLVIAYYRSEKRAKVVGRQQLADSLGIAINALRIRAHRIRAQLLVCVTTCLEHKPAH
jgi:RNA polymerase sigma factor (sigma-70 family)